MSGKVTYKDFGLAKILERVSDVNLTRLRVGVVGAKALEPSSDGRHTNAEIAVINQYGSKDGTVPARDFLRGPFQEKRGLVARLFKDVALRIVVAAQSAEVAVDSVGSALSCVIRDALMSHEGIGGPQNAESTIARKGFDHPLVETEGLANSISHQLVRSGGDVLEAGSAVGDFEAFEISEGDE